LNQGDWTPGPIGSGGAVLTSGGVPVNGSITFHLIDAYSSGTDNNFKGGMKVDDNPNRWLWVSNPVNNKQDINNGLVHFAKAPNGDQWVMVAADRLSNNGDAYIDFEFLQNGLSLTGGPTSGGFLGQGPDSGRTVGDILLTLALTQGGTTAGFFMERWEKVGNTFDYVDRTSSLSGNAFAAVNNSVIPVSFTAFGDSTYAKNKFAEGALNLTAVLGSINPCLSFGIRTLLIKTKESQSPTATIVDFIAPKTLIVDIGLALDVTNTNVSCFGGNNASITATPTGGTGPYTICLDGSVNCQTSNGSAVTFTNLSAGPHTVTLKDANNCTTSPSIVTVSQPDAVTLSLSKTNVTCNGGNNGTVTATFGGGTTPYKIHIDNNADILNTTSPKTFTGLSQGKHIVVVTDSNGCTKTDSINVGQPSAVTLSLSKTDVTCNGGNDGSVTATFGGGTSPYKIHIDDAADILNATSPKPLVV
jgi:hypothetical protein